MIIATSSQQSQVQNANEAMTDELVAILRDVKNHTQLDTKDVKTLCWACGIPYDIL